MLRQKSFGRLNQQPNNTMNDFNIPDEPDPKTKDDAYKLAMLAMHLKRLKNGDLDFNAAYGAWKDSINYIQTQYQGKSASELDFKGNVFKIYFIFKITFLYRIFCVFNR